MYDFQQYETISSVGDNIYTGKINIHEDRMNQGNLSKKIVESNNKSRTRTIESKVKKRETQERAYVSYESRELILNAFKSEIFPIKETQEKKLKILTPKQTLRRLPITLSQAKAGETFEKLLNVIR